MRAGLLMETSKEHSRRIRPKLALRWVGAGAVLTVITEILAAVNAVSPQQLIALALPAAALTIGGLIRAIVPDAWTAWRDGFRLGCETGRLLLQTRPTGGPRDEDPAGPGAGITPPVANKRGR